MPVSCMNNRLPTPPGRSLSSGQIAVGLSCPLSGPETSRPPLAAELAFEKCVCAGVGGGREKCQGTPPGLLRDWEQSQGKFSRLASEVLRHASSWGGRGGEGIDGWPQVLGVRAMRRAPGLMKEKIN